MNESPAWQGFFIFVISYIMFLIGNKNLYIAVCQRLSITEYVIKIKERQVITMKNVLVLGASGGIGSAIVQELIKREVHVKAFARNEDKMRKVLPGQSGKITFISGDVMNLNEILTASHGVDLIIHAVSFSYENWARKHNFCLQNILEAAKTNRTKFILVDNIYAYGPSHSLPMRETNEKLPHTKKGKIRLRMEKQIEASPVPSIIAHLPDVYGPGALNTLLGITIEDIARNKSARFVGPLHIPREFLYTQDAAKAIIELAVRDFSYNQKWNIPSPYQITGNEMINIIKNETHYRKNVRAVSRSMIKLSGLFRPEMKEMTEMMYLTESPVFLSGEKYERHVGELPHTSYKVGLTETVNWFKNEIIEESSESSSSVSS